MSLFNYLSHPSDRVRVGDAATTDEGGADFDHMGDVLHIILLGHAPDRSGETVRAKGHCDLQKN